MFHGKSPATSHNFWSNGSTGHHLGGYPIGSDPHICHISVWILWAVGSGSMGIPWIIRIHLWSWIKIVGNDNIIGHWNKWTCNHYVNEFYSFSHEWFRMYYIYIYHYLTVNLAELQQFTNLNIAETCAFQASVTERSSFPLRYWP